MIGIGQWLRVLVFVLVLATVLSAGGVAGVAQGAEPTWRDTLDGKADSGAEKFSGPNSAGQPALKGVSWVNDGIGQAASLGSMDSYIGYAGTRLKPDQGTILFRYKPIRDLAGAFATRHPIWTDYGQAKPPQNGFLLDTIGWNGAPKGAFALTMDPAANGNLNFLVWDGSKWHSAVWTTPDGWRWDAGRWYEIGVTWGPGGMGIFLDGEMKAKVPDVVSVSSSIPWFLGQAPWSWPYGPHSIMGVYDEVRVYGEQLAPYQPVSTGGAGASQPAPSTASGGAAEAPASKLAGASAPPAAASAPPQASGPAPTVAPAAASSGVSQPGASPKPAGAAPGAAPPAAGTQQNPDQSQSASNPAPVAGDQAGTVSRPPQAPGSGGQTASGPGSAGTASGAAGIAGELGKLTNVENLLPGGPSGDAAKTVRQLPGGSAGLWAVPILLVLLGVVLGRMGRRREPAAQVRGSVATGGSASGVGAGEARPRFCDMCGAPLPAGAGFCGKCGAEVEQI